MNVNSAISLEGVSKVFKGRQALNGVSLTVESGDIFGYLGPNGAGKTTSIRIILGLLNADSGTSSILGRPTSTDGIRQKLGFVLEADGLYENMTAYENLAFFAKIYRVGESGETIGRYLKMAGLSERSRDKVGTFSKGMRQRLALARAMVHNPDILILDEPTAGVDPSGQIEVRQIVLDMAHAQGKTIFLSSHNLDEVQRICNRIALIHRGEIKLQGELARLQTEMGGGKVEIETEEPLNEGVLSRLKSLPGLELVSQTEKVIVIALDGRTSTHDVIALLSQNNAGIEQVKKRQASLEEIYTTILKEAEQK
ncbi:MAG: ABC transporter ATP-binding protein [Dehalococcoidales bacterium]|nr:ABC transporter ATP-binding protein [Dehalococcoidales bacterium]